MSKKLYECDECLNLFEDKDLFSYIPKKTIIQSLFEMKVEKKMICKECKEKYKKLEG